MIQIIRRSKNNPLIQDPQSQILKEVNKGEKSTQANLTSSLDTVTLNEQMINTEELERCTSSYSNAEDDTTVVRLMKINEMVD